MPQDLNKPVNEWLRSVDQHVRKSAYGLLVILCIVATFIAWGRAERAIDDSKDLKAIVIGLQSGATLQQQMYKETERECRLLQMEVDNYKIVLIKAGLSVDEHIGEKP